MSNHCNTLLHKQLEEASLPLDTLAQWFTCSPNMLEDLSSAPSIFILSFENNFRQLPINLKFQLVNVLYL